MIVLGLEDLNNNQTRWCNSDLNPANERFTNVHLPCQHPDHKKKQWQCTTNKQYSTIWAIVSVPTRVFWCAWTRHDWTQTYNCLQYRQWRRAEKKALQLGFTRPLRFHLLSHTHTAWACGCWQCHVLIKVLLHFEVSALGTVGGGIISTSLGVELKGSVWYRVSESALPDCHPLIDVIPPTEQASPQCRNRKAQGWRCIAFPPNIDSQCPVHLTCQRHCSQVLHT